MAGKTSILVGLAAGAGLMYLFDPEKGRRRRSLLRDQVVHAEHKFTEEGETGSRDLVNRTKGMFAVLRRRLDGRNADDVVLEERVRSAIGRVVRHAGSVEVMAQDGVVTLGGPVLAEEVERLLNKAYTVPGVQDVINRLDVYQNASDIPGLQGRGMLPQQRGSRRWLPAARMLAGGAGAGLTLFGLRRRGFFGVLALVTGLSLGARALTNWEFRRMIGMRRRRGIDFRKTVNIGASPQRVFQLWSDYENFPRFMSNVREVHRLGDKRSHWKVGGPLGAPIQWDAVITRYEPERLLAWRTEPGSTIQHAGLVQFQRSEDGGSRITVRFSYNPGAGVLGHAVAALFHADPKKQMDDDLMLMKAFIETGRAPGDAARPAAQREEAEPAIVRRSSRGGTAGESPDEGTPNATEIRDRAAEEEVTAFSENPGSIPSD